MQTCRQENHASIVSPSRLTRLVQCFIQELRKNGSFVRQCFFEDYAGLLQCACWVHSRNKPHASRFATGAGSIWGRVAHAQQLTTPVCVCVCVCVNAARDMTLMGHMKLARME
jgi:hypothetical protein